MLEYVSFDFMAEQVSIDLTLCLKILVLNYTPDIVTLQTANILRGEALLDCRTILINVCKKDNCSNNVYCNNETTNYATRAFITVEKIDKFQKDQSFMASKQFLISPVLHHLDVNS